jgi:hypothetical protein
MDLYSIFMFCLSYKFYVSILSYISTETRNKEFYGAIIESGSALRSGVKSCNVITLMKAYNFIRKSAVVVDLIFFNGFQCSTFIWHVYYYQNETSSFSFFVLYMCQHFHSDGIAV